MSLSIQTNSASTAIANNLNTTNKALAMSLERLGTGLRINSAQDDAAGLQIANRLNSQMVGQKTAINNSNNAISMLQTAEGAFEEMTNIVTRMQELATQSSNGVYSADDRTAMNAEYQALGQELVNILENTNYGSGNNLLGKTGAFATAVGFQIGSGADDQLSVDISDDIEAVHGAVTDDTGALVVGALTDATTSKTAITSMTNLIDTLGKTRSQLGANINRLGSTINNLSNMTEASESAYGQIMDADFAEESANRSKNQMLLQSGVTVLTTANSTSQIISQLLR